MLVPPRAWRALPILSQTQYLAVCLQDGTSSVGKRSRETSIARRRPRACSHARRQGATALEFAIVAPIFFLFVLGLIELGRGIMVRHMLANAARQGCRLGIIEGTSNTQISNAATAALAPTGISSDTVTVQVNDGSSDAAYAQAGDEITVVVSVPMQNVSWVPNLRFLSGSLSGQYTMRRE